MRRAMAQRMAVAHAQVVPTTVTDDVNIDEWSKDTTLPSGSCKPSRQPARRSHRSTPGTIRKRGNGACSAASTSGSLSTSKAVSSCRCCAMSASATVTDLRAGLDRMRADAAARAIPPEELRGATITLSNFGMIGGRFASLVVVPPQVAIIGAGRAEQRVVVDRGQQVIRRDAAFIANLRSSRRNGRRSRALSCCSQIGSGAIMKLRALFACGFFLTGIPTPLVLSPRLLAPCRSHQADRNSAASFCAAKKFRQAFLSFF